MPEQIRLKAPPKTPLKRISRNSLRSQTLSTSYPTSSETHQRLTQSSNQQSISHLEHLAPLFVDLNDAITDLHVNLSNLDLVCQDLNGFNESFAAYIYGLRMNAYITDFDEAPKLKSFRAAHERKEAELDQFLQKEEAKQEAQNQLNQNINPDDLLNDNSDDSNSPNRSNVKRTVQQASTSNNSSTNPQTNQTSKKQINQSIIVSKSKSFSQASKSQQKQLLKFTEQVLISLPLKFREQQPHRHEMELVISTLKLNPNGLLIKDIVKLEPSLAMHRARDCVTSLVVAKKAIKLNKDGIIYQLSLD